MTAEVIDLPVITTLDLDPKRVLSAASKEDFERVIVIGILQDGEEYVSASAADGGTVLWDVERAKLRLLRRAD